ncbi:MAG: hypothetical protein WCK29_03915 [archaeon]
MTDDFKPRKEVIEFLRRGLETKAALNGVPFDDSKLQEIRAGTPSGRQLYEDILPLYDNGYRER